MREKEQTSIHLLLASIVTMFGTILILTIVALSWELWMVPVILIGNTLIWCLHIWALYIRKTSKRNCFRLGGQTAAPVTIGELSSIYSAIRRNSSAYLNFTLILPPS